MNGFYNVIKPIGWSSSDLVIKIRNLLRRHLGQKVKVGHLGTLDPLATGVLGIAVGSATRLFDYFLSKRKTYIATCVLGKTTDTLDNGGNVLETAEVPSISDEHIVDLLHSFVGELDQIPPAYSAKSINGVRSYKLAQKGISAELPSCHITIFKCELLERIGCDSFRFIVECSGGTYIRSLCRDIGAELSLPAYMGALERVQVGSMKIEDATTIESIVDNISSGFVPLSQFSRSLKNIDFSEDFRKMLDNGVKVETSSEDGLIAVSISGEFYAIGQVRTGRLEIVARDK